MAHSGNMSVVRFRSLVPLVAVAVAFGCQYPRPADVPNDADPTGGSDAPPNVVITAGPADASTSGPFASFSFTVAEGTPYCSFDNETPAPCTSPVERSLPEGTHSFAVQAENQQGVVDRARRTWSVVCAPASVGPHTIGLFHLDEPDGTQVLHNEVATTPLSDGYLGVGPDDTMGDPARTNSGRFGRGLMFVSPLELATIIANRELAVVTAHSASLWFMSQSASAGNYILADSGQAPSQLHYSLQYSQDVSANNRIYWYLQMLDATGSPSYSETLFVDVAPMAWHHVVVSVVPGVEARLWVDGEPHDAMQPAMLTGSTAPGTFRLAQVMERGPFFIDEIVVEDRAATAESIRDAWCPASN